MRWVVRVGAGLVLVLIALVCVVAYILRGSLAMLDGELTAATLSAPVQIERDELGVVTITAQSRLDAAYATGFVHAQERYFQMDLQRRVGAGELSALFGNVALKTDQRYRLHRFRHRAGLILENLPSDVIALYDTYSDGVNDGLAALRSKPFEYYLLGVTPQPWQAEDILLTTFSMYFELNDERATRESQLSLMRDILPASVFNWLVQSGTDWDAPLLGDPIPPVALPPQTDFDLRQYPVENFKQAAHDVTATQDSRPGSNNWAVGPQRSTHGRAIMAGDMHLGHAVPNIWFRARLVVAESGLDISGLMLSGTPLVIAGSNGHVAWSFTNSYGDWEDLVLIDTHPDDKNRYRTADGWQPFNDTIERIDVKGEAAVDYLVRETIWGPLIDTDHTGRPRALHWLAHELQGTNGGIAAFEQVTTVNDAIAAANRVGAPPQNFVVADSAGHIGWTIMGRIPNRVGFHSLTPSAWGADVGWQGWIADAQYPRIIDPVSGLLWSANTRTVDGVWLDQIGEGNYALGARAHQIRDDLRALAPLDIANMLEIQLDDRAVFLQRWQALLLAVLDGAQGTGTTGRRQLRELVADWDARASPESAGYRLVRAFRLNVHNAITEALLAPFSQRAPGFEITAHGQLERPVWQLLRSRPLHLLNPVYQDWDQFLLAVADATVDYYKPLPGALAQRTWGEVNTVRIAHPLAQGLPGLARFLNMPAVALPGDSNMPRVQAPAFGASQRMAVSPGDEGNGYLHMPGGQSGHPLSPFYGAGHADWERGVATSFLPGPARYRLLLQP